MSHQPAWRSGLAPRRPADISGWLEAHWRALGVRDGGAGEALRWWAVVADKINLGSTGAKSGEPSKMLPM